MGNWPLTPSAGSQMELIWENPNPNTSFSAQTVQLSKNNFSLIAIEYANRAGGKNYTNFDFFPFTDGLTGVLVSVGYSTGTAYPRVFTINKNDSTIYFENGLLTSSGVPIKIFGVSGVELYENL